MPGVVCCSQRSENDFPDLQARKELYREIKVVRLGHSDQLAAHFGAPGPFWGRQYLFWSGGAPLTLIHEVFSPALADYLQ